MKDLKPLEIAVSPDGFLNMLHKQNGGHLIDELNTELAKGVGAILDHGGKSEITLKIKLSGAVGVERGITIIHDVITKHPREARPAKTMFVSPGNGVLNAPAEQGELGIGEQVEAVQGGLEKTDNVSQLKA